MWISPPAPPVICRVYDHLQRAGSQPRQQNEARCPPYKTGFLKIFTHSIFRLNICFDYVSSSGCMCTPGCSHSLSLPLPSPYRKTQLSCKRGGKCFLLHSPLRPLHHSFSKKYWSDVSILYNYNLRSASVEHKSCIFCEAVSRAVSFMRMDTQGPLHNLIDVGNVILVAPPAVALTVLSKGKGSGREF